MRALCIALILTSSFVISVPAHADKVLKGQWGGKGASLYLTPNGADGTFNCLFGRIDNPTVLSHDGTFQSTGFIDYFDGNHFPEHVATIFSGYVHKKQMHLTLILSGHGEWDFDLVKDQLGDNHECAR